MINTPKAWVRICTLDHVPEGEAIGLNINGQKLILARCGESVSILQGYCSHMLFPLSGSKVEGCALTCALHRSRFDVRDGSVIDWSTFPPLVGKALALIRQQKALRTFETKVEDGAVFVLWPTGNPETVRIKV